jgi:alkaline phosphatase D
VSPLDRRRFLAGAAALVAAPDVGRTRAVQPATPFEWGVGSFDPTADGVLIWTRARPTGSGDVPLAWVLARDEQLTDVVAAGEVLASAMTDHCVTVSVDGLEPETTWWYGFTTEAGARSAVGRTRTTPARRVERLRLGVVSCSRYASGGFAAYRALAEREVDLVVHLGDYIYEDGQAGARPHDPPEQLRRLEQYRARYAQHRLDPDLQALHARHPMVAVWDDHEIAGNAWRDGAPGHDPATDGPWLDRLLAAGQAYEEWVPGRRSRGPDGRLRAWRGLSLGGLADLVVLDTRTWGRDRQPQSAGEVGGPPPGGPADGARSMLGADQAELVARRLQDPERPPWVLLANQVMFSPLLVPVPSAALEPRIVDAGFLVVDGQAVNPDQWDGYPEARAELLHAIGSHGGVVMLTGDVHSSWAWEGPANDGGQPTMVEIVVPSVSSEPLADRLPVPATAVEAGLRSISDGLSHVEISSHGYVVVDLSLDRVQAEWWYVDPADPSSERFGAGRAAPRTVPMRLEETEALPDPSPTAGPAPSTTAPQPVPADDDRRDLPLVGAGAAAAATVAAAAIAVRRRRR